MKAFQTTLASLMLGGISFLPLVAGVQSKTDTNSSAPSTITADYPKDYTGVLIDSSGWTEVPAVFPSKTHVKRAIAASLTYGAVPAAVVTEYDGLHASVKAPPERPVLCIFSRSSSDR
jgi:hypothetical protein